MEVVASGFKCIGFPVCKHYKENIERGTMGIVLAASSYLDCIFESG